MALNPHLPAAHGVAANVALIGDNARLAGEAEVAFQMMFRSGGGGKNIHALHYFHDAFFALALLAAGGRNIDAKVFGIVEERPAAARLNGLPVDGKRN